VRMARRISRLLWPAIVAGDEADILVEAENRACQQERLCDVVEQPRGDVGDLYDLIRHEGDAARDEQHRTGVLGNLESLVVFHGIRRILFVINYPTKLRKILETTKY